LSRSRTSNSWLLSATIAETTILTLRPYSSATMKWPVRGSITNPSGSKLPSHGSLLPCRMVRDEGTLFGGIDVAVTDSGRDCDGRARLDPIEAL